MFDYELNRLNEKQKKNIIQDLKKQLRTFPPLKKTSEDNNKMIKEEKAELYISLAFLLAEFPEYYSESISHFILAQDLLKELKKNKKIASIKGSIASIYYDQKDFLNAANFYKQSLDLLEDSELKKEKMIGKKGLGLSLLELDKEEHGITYLLDAAELCVDLHDIETYMTIISLLKKYYTKIEEWELIIELEKKNLTIQKERDNNYETSISYLEIGLSLSKLKSYTEALHNFKHSVNYALKSGKNKLIFSGIIMVAETFFHMRGIESSKKEYLKALSLISYIGNEEETKKTILILNTLGVPKEEINKAIENGKNERNEIKRIKNQ